MFDIGVSELFVIGVVALVVIGPEKLPRVARTIGHLTGRLQRYVNDVKADINREIELDELRRFKQEVEQSAHVFESSVREELGKTETDLNQAARQLTDPLRAEIGKTAGELDQAAQHMIEAADPVTQPLDEPGELSRSSEAARPADVAPPGSSGAEPTHPPPGEEAKAASGGSQPAKDHAGQA